MSTSLVALACLASFAAGVEPPSPAAPVAAAPAEGAPAEATVSALGAPEATAAEATATEAEAEATMPAGTPDATPAESTRASPFAPKHSDDTVRDLEVPAHRPAELLERERGAWIGEKRPSVLEPRRPFAAFVLGGAVGFGTGYYYAGEATPGLVFTLVDGALVLGFVGVTIALNDLVIAHDFRSGESLARGERDFGRREARLYAASIALALTEVASHVVQAFGGLRAAERTNAALRSFSFVPLGDGGAASWTVTW